MQLLRDVFGRIIRLTDERATHMTDFHPELARYLAQLGDVLEKPDVVVRSNSDAETELFYRLYETEVVGNKWLCVVVKARPDDAFAITAYFTDAIKKGAQLWKKP